MYTETPTNYSNTQLRLKVLAIAKKSLLYSNLLKLVLQISRKLMLMYQKEKLQGTIKRKGSRSHQLYLTLLKNSRTNHCLKLPLIREKNRVRRRTQRILSREDKRLANTFQGEVNAALNNYHSESYLKQWMIQKTVSGKYNNLCEQKARPFRHYKQFSTQTKKNQTDSQTAQIWTPAMTKVKKKKQSEEQIVS